jgi:hypothetical protein
LIAEETSVSAAGEKEIMLDLSDMKPVDGKPSSMPMVPKAKKLQ